MNGRKLVGMAGFVALGLSPSFMDWQQADRRQRTQITAYYAAALILVYVGVFT